MRFGVCSGPENASLLKKAGFDYIELGVAGHLWPLEAESGVMPEMERALDEAGLRAEAFNGMLPGELKVVGPADVVDAAKQRAYLEAAFSRARRLGGALVVFGSGGARRVPDGFPRAEAEAQIAEFLIRAGDIAGNHGMDIAIEPLNSAECNILTSVAEAMEMAERVAHPRVRVLSDLYHVAKDRQPYDETASAGASLAHVHVARPVDRLAPRRGDEAMLATYFGALRAAGYDARISIEAGWVNAIDEEATEALSVLRSAWEMSAVGIVP